jgi:hypothetical protein
MQLKTVLSTLNGIYVPIWVKSFIIEKDIKVYNLRFSFYNFSIYSKLKINDQFVKHLKSLMSKINDVLLKGEKYNKIVNIVLIMSNKKKTGYTGKVIGVDNINSGLSYNKDFSNSESVDIMVYRKEDMYKVLVHEIIHYFGLDIQKEYVIQKCSDIVSRYYKSVLNFDFFFNEAFTEAKAIYYYTLLNGNNFQIEKEFSIRQSKVFLLINKCKTVDEFREKRNYSEKSHAFSYILLKSALINYRPFITLIRGENMNDELKFIKVIEKAIQNNKWKEKVNSYFVKENGKERFNMRMSFIKN